MNSYSTHNRGTSSALHALVVYVSNRNVFNCFLQLFLTTAGSLRYSGSEFQARDGPATEKARLAKELNR